MYIIIGFLSYWIDKFDWLSEIVKMKIEMIFEKIKFLSNPLNYC